MQTLTLPPRVTDRAFARLAEIADMTGEARALRVAVEGGDFRKARKGTVRHAGGQVQFHGIWPIHGAALVEYRGDQALEQER